MKKLFILLALVLCAAFVSCGGGEKETSADAFTYDLADDGVVITAYIGTDETVNIPSKIKDHPVVEIGKDAFKDTQVTAVNIPDTVTEIGENAFRGCKWLKTVNLPDSLTDIGTYVFKGCISLESVTLPESLSAIDEGAFADCSSLKSINIHSGIKAIGQYAFEDCTSLEKPSLPEDIKIKEDSFSGCNFTVPYTATVTVSVVTDEGDICKDITVTVKGNEGEAPYAFDAVATALNEKQIPYKTEEFAGYDRFAEIDGKSIYEDEGEFVWELTINGNECNSRIAVAEINDGDRLVLSRNLYQKIVTVKVSVVTDEGDICKDVTASVKVNDGEVAYAFDAIIAALNEKSIPYKTEELAGHDRFTEIGGKNISEGKNEYIWELTINGNECRGRMNTTEISAGDVLVLSRNLY